MNITHVFFDVGGVLGTNSWDRYHRAKAIEDFGLSDEFSERHGEVIGTWESGQLTLDEYLDTTIFYEERDFTRATYLAYIKEKSKPNPETLAIARRLAENPTLRLMTLNNESEELNNFRIERFGLRGIFSAFLSSCWLGAVKPSRLIYTRALGIAQAAPEQVLFIDDRAQNLTPARALGMHTILFENAASLEDKLHEVGLL